MEYLQFLLGLTILALGALGQDYCDPTLCPTGTTHIACNNLGGFGPLCPANARVLNINSQKDLILKMFNVRRNTVANGNLPGFAPATRMGVVSWDDELAGFAQKSAMRCLAQHDQCRNTDDYSKVGQLVHLQTSTQNINYRTYIIQMIQKWYQRYQFADAAKMEIFERAPQDYSAFAIMVNDRVQKVGAYTVTYKISNILHVLTIFNFSSRNAEGTYVYQSGTTGSGCTTGRDTTYSGLCTANEEIDPNTP